MKTSPTNKKVRELISMVKEGKLVPRPEFQRRLVWSREDKNHFLDSVLRGYPFPEVYFADGEVNLETGDGTQLLVDGLQRVSTLIQYFEDSPDLKLTTVPPYRALGEDDKKAFLQYDVTVRDLGPITKDEVIDVFRRLNATKYSLLDIEINNAVYAGALKTFCERMALHPFFVEHDIFNATDYKRMGDLRYLVSIVGTLLEGYFNRDDAFESILDRYNDEFPEAKEIDAQLARVFDFIEECGFPKKSRIWKKADLFTMIIETHSALHAGFPLQPGQVLERVTQFYERVDNDEGHDRITQTYYKAALQASNDRINRIRRGVVMLNILLNKSSEEIITALDEMGL
jgi:hypothetical protein